MHSTDGKHESIAPPPILTGGGGITSCSIKN